MHRLSGGRLTLGIGRGIAAIYGAFGIPAVTTAQLEDWAQVMRRLWHGELIFNHDGPMGKYPIRFLDPDFDGDIRLALVAFGPNTLALAGRAFDDVVLHTHVTPETLQRCVKTVKSAAGKGGPRPGQRAGVVVLRHRRRPSSRTAAAEDDRRAPGHLSAGVRRSDGADQQMGSRCAATVPGRSGGDVDRGRYRSQGETGVARAHRDADSRRVAGTVGHGVGPAVRGPPTR
jgi:alkanesulfonate monooxygenase SsuD/methylene tetrahydromethanopterin reductase-like flavin-dependent oxidoreductase (luciferase family)